MSEFALRCHSVVPLVPVVLDFLRQTSISADAFISTSLDDSILAAINELFESQKSEERLTITSIKYTYTTYDEETWAKAIPTILNASTPRVIGDEFCRQLLDSFKHRKGEILKSDEECGGLLGPILDDLPRAYFQVLGQYCAFIRDNSDNLAAVCKAVARGLFNDAASENECAELFQVMVEKAEPLFGRVAAARPKRAKRG